jgi:hypothetical protein
MTFKEFQRGRQHVDDVAAAVQQPGMWDRPQSGFIYDGTWFILDPAQEGDPYFTEIENTSPEGTLEQVERRLYLFAATSSPGWVDHDFVVVYQVCDDDDDELLGVIECVIDEGVRPRRWSDTLPAWVADWFLGNDHSDAALACPHDPFFIVGGAA